MGHYRRLCRFLGGFLLSLWLTVGIGFQGLRAVARAPSLSEQTNQAQTNQAQANQAQGHLEQGMAAYRSGQLLEAIDHWQQAAELFQAPQQRARMLANLAVAYYETGQYLNALETNKTALALFLALDQTAAVGKVQSNLGNVYEALGDYASAIEVYSASRDIARRMGNQRAEGVSIANLGYIYSVQGDQDAALALYRESLAIATALNDSEGTSHRLLNMGLAYHVLGNISQATELYEQSLAIAQENNYATLEATAMRSLGMAAEDRNNYDQAIDYYHQSLAIIEPLHHPELTAQILNNLGHTYLIAHRLPEAENSLREAIQQLDNLRANLNDAQGVSVFDTQIYSYNLLTQILVAQDKIEAALEIAELGRARAFVKLIAERSDDAQLAAANQTPSIQQIRQIAQDQRATLVEYTLVPDESFKVLGKQRGNAERLYIWVVQPTGQVDFRQVDLSPLQQEKGLSIGKLVETSRDRSGIRGDTRGRIQPGDQVRREGEPLDWKPYDVIAIDPRVGTVTLSHPDFTLPNPVVPLSDVYPVNASSFTPVLKPTSQWQDLHQLLIAPIADLLPQDPEERVVFIPQEQLFLVPFPALQAADGSYLIEHHTILSAPAIQILGLTNRHNSLGEEQREKQPVGPPLVVGNPSPMPENLQALPHAATEANGIATVLSTRALTGHTATETAIKHRLSTAPLIHLATHGFFNETNPLQGSLALAPSDDQDGFLTAEEILTQSLRANLVVLSACDTGRGQITGDGVIGLSRSFLAAGAENVMVSLWQVPDDATAQLMIEFYRQRQHLDNAQALRQAMLTTRQQYQNPLAWAAFTLIGAMN
ncbi:CHAT domain-containing protein [Leptothoe sp. PORK10 BA2]|uniref:CHAT domain-containing protein n=1 Tax=Leptothoe sp. PORK10 BA2 TaxID=3110254 RepID=UPI002B20D130|nr:CHAT domain-containing tetratricopeptide repeat protein [Leptothoe sp. PORK10 BA2]MEA5463743.1 CHAT domain-containing tetratricopeptide repeat protein [Leptothoe sp. PORK10 BA2]